MEIAGPVRVAGSAWTAHWPPRAVLVLLVAFGLACHGHPQHGHTACALLTRSATSTVVNDSPQSTMTTRPRRRRALSEWKHGTAEDDWLTLAEAATLLGMSQRTVRRWADRGLLPMTRSPSGYRFRRADVEAIRVRPEPGSGRNVHE